MLKMWGDDPLGTPLATPMFCMTSQCRKMMFLKQGSAIGVFA